MKKKAKPRRAVRKTDMLENGGRVLVNLGQVMFGTLVLGSVMRGNIDHAVILIGGFTGAVIFIFIGLYISAKEKSKE